MSERRDPVIRALIFELAEASPFPPVIDLDVPRVERRLSPATLTRPRWATMTVAAAAVLVVLGGPLLVFGWISNGEPEATVPPPAPTTTISLATTTLPVATSLPITSSLPVASSTTATATTPPIDPPLISWERIEARGAFDLHEGLQDPAFGDPPVPGQQIEAILAVPACSGEPDCGDVAGYVAGGHTGIHDSQWDAAVWVSDDGRNWTAVEGPGFSDEGGQRILALATDGRRIIAAGMFSMGLMGQVPPDRALVWYSDDLGRTWNLVEEETFATGHGGMMDVAWTGDGFIGVGNGFWFSPDGLSWTLTDDEEPPVLVRSLAEWDAWWIAVGDGRDSSAAAMWRSEDGRSWELMHSDSGTGPGTESMAGALAVAAGRDGLVAVGFDRPERWDRTPAAWRSENGLSWHMVPHIPWDVTALWMYKPMEDLVEFDGWVIAVGNSWSRYGRGRPFMLASADDGISWIKVPLDPDVFDLELGASSLASPVDVRRSNGGGAGFAGIEVMHFPAGGLERIVVFGSNGTDAAIWVGTLEK